MRCPLRRGVDRVFLDKASGELTSRLALDDLLTPARSGDTVAVWRLDRLGRSLKHLIETVEALDARDVAFVSLTEAIATSTPGGRLVVHVFGALAQFERELIRDRTMAGLAAARARVGRRPADGLDSRQAPYGSAHALQWRVRRQQHRQGPWREPRLCLPSSAGARFFAGGLVENDLSHRSS